MENLFHQQERNEKRSFLKVLSVTTIFLFLAFTVSSANIHAKNTLQTEKITRAPVFISDVKKEVTMQPLPTLTPTPTLTSTSSATPSAVPKPAQEIAYSGFCLTVPVLFYHHVQPWAHATEKGQKALTVDNATFDLQMSYLATNSYNTITVKELVDALKNHTQLPAKSIAVTLDDGYKDNYTYAFPILQKYHIKANIMIATGLMEGADYLSWSQIEEMAKSGLFYFTDHTWSHYAVNHGTTDKIKYEIETARTQLEQKTGQKIDLFTYPYGSFNDTAINILKEDGFLGAFTTLPGKVQCDSFIMTLRRTRIGNANLSSYGI